MRPTPKLREAEFEVCLRAADLLRSDEFGFEAIEECHGERTVSQIISPFIEVYVVIKLTACTASRGSPQAASG
jgi:hypothetical protein